MVSVPIPDLELGSELGRGAHGVVLRGLRGGRTYAVKLPLETEPPVERQAAYHRFLREAAALARVRHPSLPAVMEVGQAGDVPYLVLELSNGETLSERLERGPLREAEVVSLAAQLSSALEAIHSAGLFHRDVKPQNIVFDAATGTARLVDLGSAIVAPGASSLSVTRAYAAPELLRGDGDFGDARADLYSLGRVLLEAIGEVPSRSSAGVGEAPDVRRASPQFMRLLGRMVATDPRERYASAAQVLSELLRDFPGETGHVPRAHLRDRLLGRDAELDRLRRAWAEVQHGGRVVVVKGAAGSGKTRLARAFVDDLAATGVRVLSAACHPRDPRAFTAVRQLVEAYLRDCEALADAERARAFSEVERIAGDVASLLKLLSPYLARALRAAPTVAGSENAEQAFSEGLSDFLGRLVCSLEPLVVFIDDTQWLDAGSLGVIIRAVNYAADSRALFVFGFRDGETTREMDTLLQAVSVPVTELPLSALADDDLVDLVRDYLAAPELDEDVKHALLRLSDGMPLHTLEVVRAFVDEGALLPHWGRWQLDRGAATRMHLPTETASLLRRRIGTQSERTRSVLTVAAVVGMAFEEDVLAAASPLGESATRAAIGEAVRAELVEKAGEGAHRFIHHTVREALLAVSAPEKHAEQHQRIAEVLALRGGSDADHLYRVAFHYASGLPARTPLKSAEACVLAAQAAFARFDNARVVEFLSAAERALGEIGLELDAEQRLLVAESRLRAGSLTEALLDFEKVLEASTEVTVQATALVRIASIHDARFESSAAWAAIEAAFSKLGEPAPSERVGYTAKTLKAWGGRRLARKRTRAIDPVGRARYEALASLYSQAGRIALNANAPLRVVLGALRSVGIAERLGPSAALAKSYVTYSFVLTVLGFPARGARYLARAEEIAKERRDPVLRAHVLQVHGVVAIWGGRTQASVDATAAAVTQYGNWMELGEYCANCYSLGQIESVRGRHLEAWKWFDQAIERVNRHDGSPVINELLLLSVRGALTALGREQEMEHRLRRLSQVTCPVPKDSALYAITFGGKVKVHTEKMDLGPAFESLVEEFESLGQDPKRVHLSVTEYYIHLAHARVHGCLRAERHARYEALLRLKAAHESLAAAAKIDLMRAHALVIGGYVDWFEGRGQDAERAFDEAQRLATAEAVPWVLYAVHRGRAHLLRDAGRTQAAHDQAVLAESIAFDHGAAYRVRFIREEFGLHPRGPATESPFSTSPLDVPGPPEDEHANTFAGGRARRQLRALLRISQARAQELSPDHQARLVVDEVVHALRAERGLLFLTAGVARRSSPGNAQPSELELEVGRDAAGREVGVEEDYDRAAVHEALELAADGRGQPSTTGRVRTTARRSAIASPLIVDDLVCGAIYLDRPLERGVFSNADGELLGALSGQVSVALELTRALRARERAEESLRNADKMDAVARLARSIAHDLNNMLSAIRMATVGMLLEPGAEQLVGEDVQTIQSALMRANELTRQLGTFSSGGFGRPQRVRFATRIERLLPVIRGLIGEGIELETRIGAELPAILMDPNQLDQLVMNLVVNARDAMTAEGRIEIELSEVTLSEAFVREHPRLEAGRYLRLEVADTGHGMDEDVRRKIFEPYFTTKRDRGGTGLGLASVYWAVSQAGGHIEVASTVGKGTSFTVFLPAEREGRAHDMSENAARRRRTILLVDSDPLAGRQLERILADLGYRVISAATGPEALAVLRDRADIALVITDVVMHGMNGRELARELRQTNDRLAVLFTTSAENDVFERGSEGEEMQVLTKPISRDALARKLADLLPDGDD